MRKREKYLAVILCVLLMFAMTACQKDTSKADTAGASTAESTQNAQESESTAKKETKETKKKEETKKETKATKESGKETSKKETKKASGKQGTKNAKAAKSNSSQKPSGHVLTIKKGNKKVYFTESQLAGMGKSTYKYSYRNKDSKHRQFSSCTGVKLSTILSKSGFSGSTAKIHSTDGYTRSYSVSDLKSSKKAFLKKTGSSAKSVPAIVTLGSSESFRLCFGQSSDDSDESGDYNAQYWIKWIDTIELY